MLRRWVSSLTEGPCYYISKSSPLIFVIVFRRYLAVGARDRTVKLYDIRLAGKGVIDTDSLKTAGDNTPALVSTFEGHKGPVTALAFRSQSLQLFSGSEDRCIRHYNMSELSYVETLYGHQAGVSGVACCTKELPFSVGRDRTARAWKLNEETHLIFRGGSRTTSADCISAIHDDFFLTGHDDGTLNLWCKDKKKPVATVATSHGQNCSGIPRGIVSCSSLAYSDLAVTGSSDGYIRLWGVSAVELKLWHL
jgi:ribosomal RNA-processing protein 9